MKTFLYKGRSTTGALKEAKISADSIDLARKKLQSQGLRLFFLEEEKGKPFRLGAKKVDAVSLMMFTRQMSTMLRAGVPVLTSIRSLGKQVENETLNAVIQQIDASVSGGKPLSQALATHPKVFGELYVNVVIAGEMGGVLPEVLERLANLIERDNHIYSEVKGALRYPFFVTVSLIGAFLFLVNFVVPKFAAMFKNFKLELPLPTKVLIWLSNSMAAYWYIYLGGAAFLYLLFRRFKNTKSGHWFLDRMALRLPVIGSLILKFTLARFANLMATLIRSGVPVLNCLDIIRKTLENVVIEAEFLKIRKRVEAGAPLHEYMQESPIFPPLLTNMIQIGEESGALDEMLDTVGAHYEMETRYAVKSLTGLIEPVMTVATGLMVLGLALSIFLPMWDMMKVARGAH